MVGMKALAYEQRLQLLDLVEQFTNNQPIDDALLADPLVVYRFLFLSKDQSDIVFDFVRLLTPAQLCQLTLNDVLTEEVMLELHLLHGIEYVQLVQWLRGLNYGGVRFFESIATEKDVVKLDDMMAQSAVTMTVVNGVQIDSVLAHYQSLDVLVDHACDGRVGVKQFRQLLAQLSPSDDMIQPVLERLTQQKQVLQKITSSQQVTTFRVYCALFDFVDQPAPHMTAIATVIEQLLGTSTLPKAFMLLNQLPYPIISAVLQRLIQQGTPAIIEHLNHALPDFTYGQLRKIVRRGGLALNYNHE